MHISTRLQCFSLQKEFDSKPIYLIHKANFDNWLNQQDSFSQNFIKQFADKKIIAIPGESGSIQKIICIVCENMYSLASLSSQLSKGNYHVEYSEISDLSLHYIGFGLSSYKFEKYKSNQQGVDVKLFLPIQYKHILTTVEAAFIVRDMITTPAEDMGPEDISNIIKSIAKEFDASFEEIVGEELKNHGYMGIYTVGKASHRPPRLVKLNWGNENHPKVSIVGKGVAFDTGGLDIKASQFMLLMHKDMGGAANAIGLAYMIMKHNLPLRLTLSIPTVENAVDAKSYRPSDIIKMKNGTTVQVTNTDAEGRLILAEPLHEEATKNPEYLIDFSTLTGAARVAVGDKISAFFCNNDDVARDIYNYGEIQQDQTWRLPLADCYRKNLETEFADISHCELSTFAGAVKAALFMEHFVGIENAPTWIHFDIMAWNVANSPGKPKGGEMMGVRAMFKMLEEKYSK
ncbi:M17 family metallopeptidase [Francisella philomiragia]|uniref:M17 family metallopeptidase n=1 Tax=Francisella philomiragia TaxID=28110 RepID=UPI0019079D69|nr:leucyl aminopeptidase family protein [Francisella philomiragia]MBK2266654.1 leucyl aminopeptidase family protein [Francisella philomiragia]MBK2278178.1 leucyl aminopeptidase family protein [Francisella philomiragia]MBK2286034.1 leucyl aminopeptidase family protein [Francisella philomiragia]MBK2287937.1 leucyl aminopeptidase family protein [Francisella philomiragia]MBK2289993.1 leucyl aminopeptidase family protein [Francisella philomiragia]